MSSKSKVKEEMGTFEAFSIVFIFIGFILNGVLVFQWLHEPGDSVIFPTFAAAFIMIIIMATWAVPHSFISAIPVIREMWWIANLLVLYWIPLKAWFL